MLFAAILAAIAIWTDSKPTLVVVVVAAGALIGINNTLTTQAVMLVSPVERPVASAAYGIAPTSTPHTRGEPTTERPSGRHRARLGVMAAR